MSYFLLGSIVLFVATMAFYMAFFFLIRYWHEHQTTLVVVPLLHAFEFFIVGFLVIALIALLLQFMPDLITLLGTS